MPLFLLHALDRPGSIDIRMANRPAHLEWAASHADKILVAGPLFQDDGETFAGSCFILNMPSLEAAKSWAEDDPYAKAGLFGTVSLTPFKWAIGDGKRE